MQTEKLIIKEMELTVFPQNIAMKIFLMIFVHLIRRILGHSATKVFASLQIYWIKDCSKADNAHIYIDKTNKIQFFLNFIAKYKFS